MLPIEVKGSFSPLQRTTLQSLGYGAITQVCGDDTPPHYRLRVNLNLWPSERHFVASVCTLWLPSHQRSLEYRSSNNGPMNNQSLLRTYNLVIGIFMTFKLPLSLSVTAVRSVRLSSPANPFVNVQNIQGIILLLNVQQRLVVAPKKSLQQKLGLLR